MGSNALELHAGKPRHLNYAPLLREDYKLLEVDEATLKEIADLGCAKLPGRDHRYVQEVSRPALKAWCGRAPQRRHQGPRA
jgi:hypothetical protein